MVAVAVIVRIIYLLQYRDSPFYQVPIWDAADYHSIGVGLSQVKLYPSLVFRAPLYPLVLGVIYLFFGVTDLLPRLVQIALGVWSCVLVMRIGERLFSKAAGMIAGIVAALSGLMIYFDFELLPTTLLIFLNLLFILEMLKLRTGEGSIMRAGIFFVLAVLTRPVVLTFLPVAVIWLLLCRNGIRDTLKFLTYVFLPLLVSLLLHIAAGSGPVLVSAQGGVNYYIGNHHEADGTTAKFPGVGTGWGWEEMHRWAEVKAGRSLRDSEVDRLFYGYGFGEIKDHTAQWLRLMWRKSILFWNRIEIPNNRDLYYHGRRFPLIGGLMWLGFPLFLPFALTGIALSWRRDSIKLITLFIIVFYATTVQFFVNARFRHPLTPLLIVLAVGGIFQIVSLLRSRDRRVVKKWLLVVAALSIGLLLPHAMTYNWDTTNDSYGLFTEGKVYEDMGQPDRAEAYYLKALEVSSVAPFVNFYIAELAKERGDLERAVDHYRREVEIQPTYGKAWNNLGVIWTELDRDTQALACFERALEVSPGMVEAARNGARIWGLRGLEHAADGDRETALGCFQRALSFQPDDPLFITMSLEARFNLGDETGVKRDLDELLSDHPGFPPAVKLLEEMGGD